MIDVLLKIFRRAHLIGMLGSGMSGLAEMLLEAGFRVSGSDIHENEAAKRLRELGATVYIGHDAKHVEKAEVVVYSNAIKPDNVEFIAAMENKIPLIPRAEMLAEMMRMKAGVAISGTHGKTTTTSLTGEALTAAGFDPTVIVGGRLRKLGGSVMTGKGSFMVTEADEFEKSFLRLTPTLVVITNIDADHIECYGSFDELESAFVQFANNVPFFGRTFVCIDEPSLLRILPRLRRTVRTYGFSPQADVRALEARYIGTRSRFEIDYHGKRLGIVELPLPGRHNVLNATAALAVGLELGADFQKMTTALLKFEGIHRRFEIHGERGNVLVVDDFAHHPAEIEATLAGAKGGWDRRIVAVFQPHLYSRTLELGTLFGRSLLGADVAIVLPIYPAREEPVEGVSSRLIYDAAREYGHKNVLLLEDKSNAIKTVINLVQPNDLVLVLGAGDVYKLAPQVLKALPA